MNFREEKEVVGGGKTYRIGALDAYGDPNTLTIDIGTSSLSQPPSANTCQVEIEKFVGIAPKPTGFNGPKVVDIEGHETIEV